MNRTATSAPKSCAILTPPGRGAVAVIVVAGANRAVDLEPLFESASGAKLSAPANQRIFYGAWKSTGEDVVLVRADDDRIEIHCHGGVSAPASILDSLITIGFDNASREQFANQLHSDPWKAETALALANVLTEKTAALLLHQYQIADARFARWEELLISDPDALADELARSLAWESWGFQLTRPRSIVFCGQPNVGKSSLMNAIAGFARTIVHETAGTTRDVIAHTTAIDGWPVILKDTAGLRTATGEIEQIGIRFAEQAIRDADLVIAVVDASRGPLTAADRQWLLQVEPAIVVFNKQDLIKTGVGEATGEFDVAMEAMPPRLDCIDVLTSTVTAQGIGNLLDKIAVHLAGPAPLSDLLIPVTSVQSTMIAEMLE